MSITPVNKDKLIEELIALIILQDREIKRLRAEMTREKKEVFELLLKKGGPVC